MELDQQMQLIEYYKELGDEEIKELLLTGKDAFEDGVFEIIKNEAHSRKIEAVDSRIPIIETNYDKMSRGELLDILSRIETLDKLNYHLISAEAIIRNIDMNEIQEFKEAKYGNPEASKTEIETIDNPQLLIITKTLESARFYTEKLVSEGISFEIQIAVDEKNYRKAELITNQFEPD